MSRLGRSHHETRNTISERAKQSAVVATGATKVAIDDELDVYTAGVDRSEADASAEA
jgi:hypothetical protein